MITNIPKVLETIHGGRLVEIRAIGVPTRGSKRAVWSGYFDDYSAAAEAAKKCEEAQATGIYMTLNTIHTGLIARSPNLLDTSPLHTTTDKEVLRHQWILFDVDPVRPSGISSTKVELEYAKLVRDDIVGWIRGKFPKSLIVTACSGNGYHALVQQEMSPADQKDLVVMANRLFGIPEVSIDKSVNKPAQLTKLYGTTARKGFSTHDRPHRMSGIEQIMEGYSNGNSRHATESRKVPANVPGPHPN